MAPRLAVVFGWKDQLFAAVERAISAALMPSNVSP
jgi:hypothetical protein